jgi:hypothetical protein
MPSSFETLRRDTEQSNPQQRESLNILDSQKVRAKALECLGESHKREYIRAITPNTLENTRYHKYIVDLVDSGNNLIPLKESLLNSMDQLDMDDDNAYKAIEVQQKCLSNLEFLATQVKPEGFGLELMKTALMIRYLHDEYSQGGSDQSAIASAMESFCTAGLIPKDFEIGEQVIAGYSDKNSV